MAMSHYHNNNDTENFLINSIIPFNYILSEESRSDPYATCDICVIFCLAVYLCDDINYLDSAML